MSVRKIIYVTPGETKLGELSQVAVSQFRKIIKNVLGCESRNTMVFRKTKANHPVDDSLLHISNKIGKDIDDTGESASKNILSNPGDITEIVNSTKQGEVAIVGVTQEELKNALDLLKGDGYDVVDKKEINRPYDVYTVTVDADSTKSNFFVAKWGQK